MLVTIQCIRNRDNWWTYEKVRKFLSPMKIKDYIFYYNIEDVEIIEKMIQCDLLDENYHGRIIAGDHSSNIANLIKVEYPKKLNYQLEYRRMKKYLKKIKNKYNSECMSNNQMKQSSTLISNIRHDKTNYEEIIYGKLDKFCLSCSVKLDKNSIITKLKYRINKRLYYLFPEFNSKLN